MSTVFTEGLHPGEFLLSEADFHRSRDNIVVASGQGVLKPGTVVAVVASGKFVAANATGSDGSQTAVGVLLYGVDATSADAPVAAITRDAEVKASALVYDVSVDQPAEFAAKKAQLAAVGIIIR